MIKKIIFVIVMLIISYFLSFIVMYNETLDSVESTINTAIRSKDFTNILAYNDYYIDTPSTYVETDEYLIQINHAYNEDVQSLSIIIVDYNKRQGEESELLITCQDTYSYTDIFTNYEAGSIAVITLFKTGDDPYALDESCSLGFFENLLVIANDGETIISLDDEVGFTEDQDILNGTVGFTADEVQDHLYPNGLVKPLILPISILWISVIGLIYIYKKFLKKKENF